mgnify:CR=1 FL=1
MRYLLILFTNLSLCLITQIYFNLQITDIILSYETNTVLQMLSIYSLIPPLVMFITNPLYNILFIGSSIIHFSHDSYSIIPLLLILDYSVNPTHFIDVFNYIKSEL